MEWEITSKKTVKLRDDKKEGLHHGKQESETNNKNEQRSQEGQRESQNTFPLLLDRLGFRDGKTLHGLVLLPRRVLLLRHRPGFAISVRVDQHAAVESVAIPAG